MAFRLAVSWWRKLGIANHNSAMAPAIWGVAMDVPLKFAYELSLALVDERVPAFWSPQRMRNFPFLTL
jgi:hypothetical protein